MCKFLCRRTSCTGSATSSEKVAEILKTLREDSQIDFVTGNIFCTFLSDPLPPNWKRSGLKSIISLKCVHLLMQMMHKIGPTIVGLGKWAHSLCELRRLAIRNVVVHAKFVQI